MMFRVCFKLFNPVKPPAAEAVHAVDSKFLTRFALGYNPNQPPENVRLYREAVTLYEKGHYGHADDALKNAIDEAKKGQGNDDAIRLYKAQREKIREFVTAKEKARAAWWKSISVAMGSASTIGIAANHYFGSRKASTLIP